MSKAMESRIQIDASTIEILGVKVHCVDFEQMLKQITQWIDKESNRTTEQSLLHSALCPPGSSLGPALHQICTVNPEFIMQARRDPTFADVLRQADLCVPDGIGVLWAARRRGVPLRERVTGSDGIYHICQRAAKCGWRIYLLGAATGIAEAAADRLITLYPRLQVVGAYSGSPQTEEWPEIYRRLQEARPDILFVAYGHPRQDLWIARHRYELPAKVALGVGGAFDFVAGITPRAPGWMQQWGLEWLYRLIQQPWRWRRMAVLPLFIWLVMRKR